MSCLSLGKTAIYPPAKVFSRKRSFAPEKYNSLAIRGVLKNCFQQTLVSVFHVITGSGLEISALQSRRNTQRHRIVEACNSKPMLYQLILAVARRPLLIINSNRNQDQLSEVQKYATETLLLFWLKTCCCSPQKLCCQTTKIYFFCAIQSSSKAFWSLYFTS